MNFIETRGNDGIKPKEVSFSQAILNPSASFGGLYVPKNLPTLEKNFIQNHLHSSYKELAFDILKAFDKLYSKEFKEALKTTINPYGNTCASEKIVEVLKSVNLENILKKSFYDLKVGL